jgi:hypothetical protein
MFYVSFDTFFKRALEFESRGYSMELTEKIMLLKADGSRITCNCLLEKTTSLFQVLFKENGFQIERAMSKETESHRSARRKNRPKLDRPRKTTSKNEVLGA